MTEDVAGIAAAGTQMAELLAIAGTRDHIVTIANYAARDAGVRFSGGSVDAVGALTHVAELAADERFRVRTARAFDLSEAPAAHRISESRKANGKVVLLVSWVSHQQWRQRD